MLFCGVSGFKVGAAELRVDDGAWELACSAAMSFAIVPESVQEEDSCPAEGEGPRI